MTLGLTGGPHRDQTVLTFLSPCRLHSPGCPASQPCDEVLFSLMHSPWTVWRGLLLPLSPYNGSSQRSEVQYQCLPGTSYVQQRPLMALDAFTLNSALCLPDCCLAISASAASISWLPLGLKPVSDFLFFPNK